MKICTQCFEKYADKLECHIGNFWLSESFKDAFKYVYYAEEKGEGRNCKIHVQKTDAGNSTFRLKIKRTFWLLHFVQLSNNTTLNDCTEPILFQQTREILHLCNDEGTNPGCFR